MRELFNSNTKIVYKVFNDKIKRKVTDKNMEDDLIQIGMLALWKCCMKYDPERGTQFSTYAFSAVYKSMLCALVREKRKTAYIISMNESVKNDSDVTYEDVIASPVSMISKVEIDDVIKRITKEIGGISDKVVQMIKDGHSQADVAKELNTTRANVCKILKKFRKKVKNTLFLED